MSGEAFLLDSVVVIDHLNGIAPATEFIRSRADRCQISAITRAEVLSGVAPGQARAVRMLLDRFPLISIDAPVADRAAALRQQHRWRLPDALQAAAALQHGLLLATRNTKDFPPRRHPFVRVPYVL
jgi:predicted nucleic acid-binding protein